MIVAAVDFCVLLCFLEQHLVPVAAGRTEGGDLCVEGLGPAVRVGAGRLGQHNVDYYYHYGSRSG